LTQATRRYAISRRIKCGPVRHGGPNFPYRGAAAGSKRSE
jgi:hypothetical protein